MFVNEILMNFVLKIANRTIILANKPKGFPGSSFYLVTMNLPDGIGIVIEYFCTVISDFTLPSLKKRMRHSCDETDVNSKNHEKIYYFL